jgi:hypothetical protein
MPLFRALAKNIAASYFGKNYLTLFPQRWDLYMWYYVPVSLAYAVDPQQKHSRGVYASTKKSLPSLRHIRIRLLAIQMFSTGRTGR